MLAEKLSINNFAGITDAEIELARMNVLIGPQASGKSVCAKLFFFFKEAIGRAVLGIMNERTKPQIRADDREIFLNYFPANSWGKGAFKIEYYYGDFSVSVHRKGRESATVDITYSEYYNHLLLVARQTLRKIRESEEDNPFVDVRSEIMLSVTRKITQDIGPALSNENYFIPAGRSFFSTVQSSVFSFLASNLRIDPFLAQFGRLYERYRNIYRFNTNKVNTDGSKLRERVNRLVCGTYIRVSGEDFIQTADERQVPLAISSSGQQEVLPLAITLASLARITRGSARRSTFVVEEPEAHLYPSAQREIVHLFAATTDLSVEQPTTQFIITTHSPYILSALNNLMYGAKISFEHPDKRSAVLRLLDEDVLIAPQHVSAYAFGDGKVRSIIDTETGLVQATVLDRVSGEIAHEFERLMSLDSAE